jgi:nitrite reductase (NADH) small subunit
LTLTVGGALRRACHVSDVPFGEGRAVTIDGHRIALFHSPGGWYALDAACPHLGGPLADGLLADRRVICPLHERAFDLATGESPSGDRVCAHGVRVIGDQVWVALSASRAAA